MLKKLRKWLRIHTCDHTYLSDTQIKVIRCTQCGDERWYDYKALFPRQCCSK